MGLNVLGCRADILGNSRRLAECCFTSTDDDDDELMLNVLRCHETY